MAFACLILSVLFSSSKAVDVPDILECSPPDRPVWGDYGPKLNYYLPGDVIHYFCDVDTYIGGNFYRKCLDTGDFTGDTPVCDPASKFKEPIFQSSTYEGGEAEAATDGMRTTCSETIGGEREEWFGNFTEGGQLMRVMLYLPKGPVNLEVVLTKDNGEEVVCGRQTRNIDRYDWTIQNCPGPNNRGATGLKIKSLTNAPLKLCEIQAHVLSTPRCTDPHYRIEGGHLRITRKSANLVCDKDYKRGPDVKLECVRDGEWNRKTLICNEPNWNLDDAEPMDSDEENRPRPEVEPKRASRRERLRTV